MSYLQDCIESTAEIALSPDPFDRIVGQNHAVTLVRSAVIQRRHVLLCGVPGIGKSMLAKAASTLLAKPRQEICIKRNPDHPDRPLVAVRFGNSVAVRDEPRVMDVSYIRPEEIPFDVALEMGFRCTHCAALSTPNQRLCMNCGMPKRSILIGGNAYHDLFRKLDVVPQPAMERVARDEMYGPTRIHVAYCRESEDLVRVVRSTVPQKVGEEEMPDDATHIIVGLNTSRFVRVSGASPAELLGDIKHDPYGSATSLGVEAHKRVVPGAVHEAHEGILYVDEIAALGQYQKHLLTAMQEKKYPIVGRNPHSSGAAVRVDDVPCDFILFASCNLEDLQGILPPLRSRIRGNGYEIMLASWMAKTPENAESLVKFMAQTVADDGRIPHLSANGVGVVLELAEKMAREFDGKMEAYTLRLRELGGLIRIAGDIAVQHQSEMIEAHHVTEARTLSTGVHDMAVGNVSGRRSREDCESYGDYFF